LAKVRKYRKATGRLPKGPEYAALYSFLIPTHRIHGLLPPEVKIPFEGRLREAVNGLNGARPFAYEISIATHLMQKGWDVESSTIRVLHVSTCSPAEGLLRSRSNVRLPPAIPDGKFTGKR
jgi:hypothetical protein